MPRLTVFARIAAVAGSVFILLHVYLMARTPLAAADLAIATLGLATIAGYSLIRSRRTTLTRLLVRTAFVWTGLAFFAGCLFLLASMFTVTQRPGSLAVWFGSLMVGLVGFLDARNPVIRRRTINGPFTTRVRIVQISDIHIGDVWTSSHLDRIVRRALRQRPDIIVVTGDLLDGMEPVDARAVAPFSGIGVPVYFVSGNHDSYTRRDSLLECLSAVGVTPLEGKIRLDADVSILGIAYGMPPETADQLLEEFRSAPRPRIVLKHKPDRLDAIVGSVPDAVLCGHVHGGQIWPLGHLARLEFLHADGTRWFGRTLVHVNQGTATWGPPFRLGTRSEITVIDFMPE